MSEIYPFYTIRIIGQRKVNTFHPINRTEVDYSRTSYYVINGGDCPLQTPGEYPGTGTSSEPVTYL